MTKNMKTQFAMLIVFSMLTLIMSPMLNQAKAAKFTEAMFRADDMTASVADVTYLISFKPVTVTVEDEVRIDFAAGYTVDGTPANITTSTASLPASCTAVPTLGATAASVSSQQVDFVAGDMTPGTEYCFFITAGVDNPTAGQYTNTISTLTAAAVVDSSQTGTHVVAGKTITITAVVPPSFTCALSATTDAFTTDLATGSIVSTTGVDATVTTNAANGWKMWAKSANQGLDSTATGDTIDTTGTVDSTCTALTAGTEMYQMDVNIDTDSGTAGTGTVSVDAEYDCTDGTHGGTHTAAYTQIASADGVTDGDTVTLTQLATISALTAAGTDYTDTISFSAAGVF